MLPFASKSSGKKQELMKKLIGTKEEYSIVARLAGVHGIDGPIFYTDIKVSFSMHFIVRDIIQENLYKP